MHYRIFSLEAYYQRINSFDNAVTDIDLANVLAHELQEWLCWQACPWYFSF